MAKNSKELMKRVTGRVLSIALALTLAVVPFSTSFSSTAQADPASEITLQSAVISNNNQDVTLSFNVPVAAAGDYYNLQSSIEIKETNEGAFNSLSNRENGDYAEISSSTVIVHFYSPLVGDSNQIRVKAGALIGSEDSSYALTSDQVSGNIAAHDLTIPYLESTTISSDLKQVTLTLNTTVQTATYAIDSEFYNVDLYDFVRINNIQENSVFLPLTSENTISISGNQIIISFAAPLSGRNEIQILDGAVKGANDGLNNEIYADVNTNPIAYSGYNYNYNSYYYTTDLSLYFTQSVVNNTLSDDALKEAITISKDGGPYAALGVNDTATTSTTNNSIPTLKVSNEDGRLNLHFFTPLAPGIYTVKIAASALKSSIGIVAGELTTNTITISDVTGPIYQNVEVSADRKVVTLTFDKNLYIQSGYYYNQYWNYFYGDSIERLRYNLYIARNNNNSYNNLSTNDIVEISNNKVIITLETALSGNYNKISINSGVLRDEFNNVQNSGVVTSIIDVSVTTPPQYLGSTLDNLNQDWTLFFDKNIKNNTASLDELKAAITLSIYGGLEKSLDSSTTLAIIDNKLVLHFSAPLVDNNIQVHIAANVIADEQNNVLSDIISTNYLSPNNLYPPEFYGAYLFTSHTVGLYFNNDLLDNTGDATGALLKAAVTYSTDQGKTFSPLQAGDVVILHDDYLTVYFKNLLQGNLQIKIAANTLKDTSGNILQTSIVTGDIETNYAPTLTGSFFINGPSVLTFEDNPMWRSKIQKVTLNEYANNWAERTLSPDEYTLSAGKLTINQGVLEEGVDYQIMVYSDGFNYRYSNGMTAIQSQNSYFITPVVMDTASGITAKVKILENESEGHLHVIFQLMNGNTPVSIVAAESDYFSAGTFTANFNVADALSNPNYTVRAFVVSEYSNNPLSVGLNLASLITEAEYDLLQNNNNQD